MPTPEDETRAAFWRSGPWDMLLNDPDGWVTDNRYDGSGPFGWIGLDSGGGATPIGPHGPWRHGPAAAIVTRATALITGPLTSAPFRVVDASAASRTVEPGRWLTDPMLTRPDARFPQAFPAALRLSRAAFWADWVRCAIWWGTGAFIAAEDAYGAPLAGSLRLINPALLTTVRGASGALVWELASDDANTTDRATFDREGRIRLGAFTYRIVTLRNPHGHTDSEGHTPGVFETAPGVFRLAGQMDSYASGTFRSGIPAGYLKANQPFLSQEAADDLKAAWMKNHGSDRRSIAVLNATTDFTPLTFSPVDAALGELKRLNVADVAFAFGLDPLTLGAGLNNSATYTNIRDAWENHADFGLAPWIAGVEDTLSSLYPANLSVKVNLDQFANPTPAERYAAYSTALTAGILTVPEVRKMEGLPPLPEPEPARPVPPELAPDDEPEPDTEAEPETDTDAETETPPTRHLDARLTAVGGSATQPHTGTHERPAERKTA